MDFRRKHRVNYKLCNAFQLFLIATTVVLALNSFGLVVVREEDRGARVSLGFRFLEEAVRSSYCRVFPYEAPELVYDDEFFPEELNLRVRSRRVSNKLSFINFLREYLESEGYKTDGLDFTSFNNTVTTLQRMSRQSSRQASVSQQYHTSLDHVEQLELFVDKWALYSLGYEFSYYNDFHAHWYIRFGHAEFHRNVHREMLLLNKCFQGMKTSKAAKGEHINLDSCRQQKCNTATLFNLLNSSRAFENAVQDKANMDGCGYTCVAYLHMSSRVSLTHEAMLDATTSYIVDLLKRLETHPCTKKPSKDLMRWRGKVVNRPLWEHVWDDPRWTSPRLRELVKSTASFAVPFGSIFWSFWLNVTLELLSLIGFALPAMFLWTRLALLLSTVAEALKNGLACWLSGPASVLEKAAPDQVTTHKNASNIRKGHHKLSKRTSKRVQHKQAASGAPTATKLPANYSKPSPPTVVSTMFQRLSSENVVNEQPVAMAKLSALFPPTLQKQLSFGSASCLVSLVTYCTSVLQSVVSFVDVRLRARLTAGANQEVRNAHISSAACTVEDRPVIGGMAVCDDAGASDGAAIEETRSDPVAQSCPVTTSNLNLDVTSTADAQVLDPGPCERGDQEPEGLAVPCSPDGENVIKDLCAILSVQISSCTSNQVALEFPTVDCDVTQLVPHDGLQGSVGSADDAAADATSPTSSVYSHFTMDSAAQLPNECNELLVDSALEGIDAQAMMETMLGLIVLTEDQPTTSSTPSPSLPVTPTAALETPHSPPVVPSTAASFFANDPVVVAPQRSRRAAVGAPQRPPRAASGRSHSSSSHIASSVTSPRSAASASTCGECVVCLEWPQSTTLAPCGHRCLCLVCTRNLLGGQVPLCPICRNEVKSYIVREYVV